MSTYHKFSFLVFALGLVAGTYLAGNWLADHPQHLLVYLWPLLKAEIFASNSLTADWIVHGPAYGVPAAKLIAAWHTQNPDAYQQLVRAFTWSPFAGLVLGLALWSFAISLDPGPGPVRHLRGRYLASVKEVTAAAKRLYGAGSLLLGSLRIPEWLEPEGALVCGAPGKGKTTAIAACIDTALQRGDQMAIADQNGALMAHYSLSNNLLALNPFEARGRDWSPLAEIEKIHDAPRLAKSMIPDAQGTEARQWTMYAQQLATAVLERLHARGNATNAEFLRFFRPEGQADLKALVLGKSVSAIFMPGNERLAANVNGVLSMYLSPYEYLNPEAGAKSFSITRWVQNGRGRPGSPTGRTSWTPCAHSSALGWTSSPPPLPLCRR